MDALTGTRAGFLPRVLPDPLSPDPPQPSWGAWHEAPLTGEEAEVREQLSPWPPGGERQRQPCWSRDACGPAAVPSLCPMSSSLRAGSWYPPGKSLAPSPGRVGVARTGGHLHLELLEFAKQPGAGPRAGFCSCPRSPAPPRPPLRPPPARPPCWGPCFLEGPLAAHLEPRPWAWQHPRPHLALDLPEWRCVWPVHPAMSDSWPAGSVFEFGLWAR